MPDVPDTMRFNVLVICAAMCALGAGVDAKAEPSLREVTVQGRSDALGEQRSAATQKTIIDRQEIQSLGGLTVGELVRKLPGIDAGDHGADGGMQARARGMGRDAVQFLVNGERPTANARFALTEVGRMPTHELERVEILRGGSAEFGGAAAVTVNLVTRQPVARASTMLKVALGQRGNQPNGQFTVSQTGGDGGFAWLLPLTVNRHAMPVDTLTQRTLPDSSRQQDAEMGQYSMTEVIVSPRLSWRQPVGPSAGQFTLWPSLYHNEGSRSARMTRSDGTGRQDEETSRIRIARLRGEGEWRAWGGKWTGRAGVMQGERQADRERTSTAATSSTSAWHETERRQDREQSASLRFDRPVGDHLWSAGTDAAHHRREDSLAFTGALASAARFTGSDRHATLWLQDEWALADDLTLTSGLRGERMRIWAEQRQSSHGGVDPSVALRWEAAPGWVARTSLAGAIRFPKLDELTAVASRSASANTPLEPDRAGNPWLVPERVLNAEAGLERHVQGGVLGLNTYVRRTHNFVERQTTWEGTRWVERPVNQGNARHWGLELSAKLQGGQGWWANVPGLGRGASVRAHLGLPRGQVQDTQLALTRAPRDLPRHTLTLGYEGSLPALRATWGMQWAHSGTVRTRVPGDVVSQTRPRNVLDVHLVHRLNAALNLRLSVQNLLAADTRRTATASTAAGQTWGLATTDTGQRTVLLTLEGKW